MAIVITNDIHYQNIANKIREAKGTEETMLPSEMADKVGEVFELGKQDFGTKGVASGTELILENVNEHKHMVSVNLTSDTITDFSGVSVKTKGENLFNQEGMLTDSNFTKAEYNELDCIKIIPTSVGHKFPCEIPANTDFRLSFEIAYPKGIDMYGYFVYEDGTKSNNALSRSSTSNMEYFSKVNGYTHLTHTKKIVAVVLQFYSYTTAPYYIRNFMINVGTEYKDYEPYAEPAEYQANANGIVEDVESFHSTMYLSTDIEGVTINAEYYLDGAKELEKYKNIILDLGGEI